MENETINECYCCKKEKEGIWITCGVEKRFCCNDCNHLNKEKQ